jgi:hypothetical protein
MNIALGQRLIALGAVVLALWLGLETAYGDYALPAVAAALALGGCLVRFLRVPIGPLLLGTIVFGYFVGNRGFAQLMLIPGFPLLPAEFVLLVGGAWLLIQCAFTRRLPFRRDVLNGAIILWLGVGSARVLFDIRQFGIVAIRDFAMVYYALFFFLGQYCATTHRGRSFLLGTLVCAGIAAPIAALLSNMFPVFFQSVLVFRGVPLILFKGDLALTFTALSALLLAFIADGRWRWLALTVATAEFVAVLGGDNRASALGAVAALGWLTLSPARRFVGGQVLAVAAAVLVITAAAHLTDSAWAERKLQGVTERVYSLTDFFGRGRYVSDESVMKGDNNLFRTYWWRAVIDETMAENPALGLGFGHDLAQSFLRQYNPEMADDFTARSPHSILVSTFGRMGFIGAGAWLLLIGVITVRTWRAVRNVATPRRELGLWACVWVIFVSACFGVVLEGPMAAVLFWTILGLLNAPELPDDESAVAASASPADEKPAADLAASLPSAVAADEVREFPVP